MSRVATTASDERTASLPLVLAGPMQAWGSGSVFGHREAGDAPTLSGVLGLVMAALGWPRDREAFPVGNRTWTLNELGDALRLTVRLDRPGTLARDFQTAGGERREGKTLGRSIVFERTAKGRKATLKPQPYGTPTADSAPGKTARRKTVISDRYFLGDAVYTAWLTGPRGVLTIIEEAVTRPVFPLGLGRRAMPPATPLLHPAFPLVNGPPPIEQLERSPLCRRCLGLGVGDQAGGFDAMSGLDRLTNGGHVTCTTSLYATPGSIDVGEHIADFQTTDRPLNHRRGFGPRPVEHRRLAVTPINSTGRGDEGRAAARCCICLN